MQTLSTWNFNLCLSGGLQLQDPTGCFITVSVLSVQSFTPPSSVKRSQTGDGLRDHNDGSMVENVGDDPHYVNLYEWTLKCPGSAL